MIIDTEKIEELMSVMSSCDCNSIDDVIFILKATQGIYIDPDLVNNPSKNWISYIEITPKGIYAESLNEFVYDGTDPNFDKPNRRYFKFRKKSDE